MMITCCQDHILTENIWFTWSKSSYNGYKKRYYHAVQTNNEQGKIELLSSWKLEAEFRNFISSSPSSLSSHVDTWADMIFPDISEFSSYFPIFHIFIPFSSLSRYLGRYDISGGFPLFLSYYSIHFWLQNEQGGLSKSTLSSSSASSSLSGSWVLSCCEGI